MNKQWMQKTISVAMAAIAALLAFAEGWTISKYLLGKTSYILLFVIPFVCGILVFALVSKYIKKKTSIFRWYIVSILVSFSVIILIGMLLVLCFSSNMFSFLFGKDVLPVLNSSDGAFFLNLLFITDVILAVVFGGFLFLLTRKKVQYIEYISREVACMEQEGLEHRLSVEGDDELAKLSQSINHMADSLYRKEKSEREFITNISHDLRSPMASILGYVVLLKQNGTNNPEKFAEYIEVVERRLHGLKEMMDELFELSKLTEKGAGLNLQEQDMMLLLRQVALENEFVLSQSGFALEYSIPEQTVLMQIDAEKIARAIQNLFDNAGKYAVKNTSIRFDAMISGKQIKISMQNQIDNGHTLDVSLLFDRFYKADEARSNTGNSGLGLAIVKQVVQMHGGEVKAEAIENSICFEICLPIKKGL